ncbi:hypothetical protein [Paraburkholderia dinghuensis]|uniref:Uncharacterized protein n=1 Tax=Paraburkholderia dinghuensis TaxID=2305225 RepID=A0A3N6Q927_9BURK|nr:hypothetical protein [Paraburkholderia dinghuensis]RQH09066.1 hypothetical protein D1Y85_04165 [Paraburkholderia dinghuensis]
MHTQSTLDGLGRQPCERLNIIGTRVAGLTWFYQVVVLVLAWSANQLKIPKSPHPAGRYRRRVTFARASMRRSNRIPDYPATTGPF